MGQCDNASKTRYGFVRGRPSIRQEEIGSLKMQLKKGEIYIDDVITCEEHRCNKRDDFRGVVVVMLMILIRTSTTTAIFVVMIMVEKTVMMMATTMTIILSGDG